MARLSLMLAGLLVLTAAIYWQSHRFEFVDFDDADYVDENRYVHAGFTRASIDYAMTTYAMGNWNPLLWFSFFLDSELFHAKPGPMHLENALLHLITGLLLWRLLFVSTGSINRSFVVAALFLCHPMHVESVAWISERKDVLSTPILLAAMLAYVRYCRRPAERRRWVWYTVTLILFVLSLLAKPMGVTLPAVLLLLDYWPLRRWPGRSWIWLVVEKLPLFAIAAAASIVGSVAQYKTGGVIPLSELGRGVRIENAFISYVTYIAKLIVPMRLAVYYPYPASHPLPAVITAAFLLLIITGLLWRSRARFPFAFIGWLWFLGTLLPVIGLVQLGGQAMADRYSYFPSIGLLIALVWGSTCLVRIPSLRWFLASTTIVGLAFLAHQQASYWHDSRALFTHDLDVAEDNPVAHVVLGQVALRRGDPRLAVDENKLALNNGPDADAYYGLGMCWLADDPELACKYLNQAVTLQPRAILFHVKYSAALLRVHRWDQAYQQAQAAVKLDPGDPRAIDQLAKVLAQKPGTKPS